MVKSSKDSKVKHQRNSKLKLIKKKKILPAIFCDIDGVVLEGTGVVPTLIGNSGKMIRRILAPTALGPALPFTFMTNGGMVTEQTKCDKLNKLFELTEQEPSLTVENINLCHTILGSP